MKFCCLRNTKVFLVDTQLDGNIPKTRFEDNLKSASVLTFSDLRRRFGLPEVPSNSVKDMVKAIVLLALTAEETVQELDSFNKAFYDDKRNAMVDTHSHPVLFMLPHRNDEDPLESQAKKGKPNGISRIGPFLFEIKGKDAKPFDGLLQGLQRGLLLATTHHCIFSRFFVLVADKDRFWLLSIVNTPITERKSEHTVDLHIFPVTASTLCRLWRSLTLQAEHNLQYFFTEDARTLRNVLECKGWAWQDCKIKLAGHSSSHVYKICPSHRKGNATLPTVFLDHPETIIVKVCRDEERFANECAALQKIAATFVEDEFFYALAYYDGSELREFPRRKKQNQESSEGGSAANATFVDAGLEESGPGREPKKVVGSKRTSAGDSTTPSQAVKKRKTTAQPTPAASQSQQTSDTKKKTAAQIAREDYTDTWFHDGILNDAAMSKVGLYGALVMRAGFPIDSATVNKTALLQDLLENMTRIHHGGVLHCDLRAVNMLRFEPGGYQIIDFDLAKIVPEDKHHVIFYDIHANDGQARGFPPSKMIQTTASVSWNAKDDILMLLHTLMKDFGVTKDNF